MGGNVWYAIACKSEAEAQRIVKELGSSGMIAEAHPIALPFAPEIFFPAIAFPEEVKEDVLRALSLEDGPTTATSDPKLKLILTEPVTVLGQRGDLDAVVAEVLKIYAPELGVHILATNPHGRPVEPVEEPGILHIRFYSAPRKSSQRHNYSRLFGRAIPAGMSDGLPPTGMGTAIRAPEGVVAEVHGNNLYILFDLPHPARNNNTEELACYLLAQIMERFLDIRAGSQKRRRAESLESEYVKACLRRRRLQLVDLKGQRTMLERRIEEARRTIERSRRELEGVLHALNRLERQAPDILEAAHREFEELTRSPHVTRIEISGEWLHVYTDEIYLHLDSKAYLMGRYVIKIPMFGRGALTVVNQSPRKGTGAALYHHPHISGDGGRICLGNFAPIQQLIAEQEWALVAQLMIEFLHHVNTDVGNYLKVLQQHWTPLKKARPCICQAGSKSEGGVRR